MDGDVVQSLCDGWHQRRAPVGCGFGSLPHRWWWWGCTGSFCGAGVEVAQNSGWGVGGGEMFGPRSLVDVGRVFALVAGDGTPRDKFLGRGARTVLVVGVAAATNPCGSHWYVCVCSCATFSSPFQACGRPSQARHTAVLSNCQEHGGPPGAYRPVLCEPGT